MEKEEIEMLKEKIYKQEKVNIIEFPTDITKISEGVFEGATEIEPLKSIDEILERL